MHQAYDGYFADDPELAVRELWKTVACEQERLGSRALAAGTGLPPCVFACERAGAALFKAIELVVGRKHVIVPWAAFAPLVIITLNTHLLLPYFPSF